jgi:nucleoside-diphosphate-sugar epimerase
MILVTGATGFIGSHLVEALCAAGEPVRCLIRRKTRPAGLPSSAETAYADLSSGAGVADALAGVDTVIHLAGVTKALAPADYYTGNVGAAENLARAAAGRGLRFVHASSLAAIGPSNGGVPLTEDAEPQPFTHYGRSKLEGERAVRRILPEAVIVRPPVVYGPRDTDVFQLLKSISRGLVLEISGGDRWFSAVYVEDLVAGLMVCARHPRAPGRTYFLAHPKPLSWSEFGAAAARVMHRRPRTIQVPPAAARAAGFCAEIWARWRRKPGIVSREKIAEAQCAYWTCNPERAARELGFRAETAIEEGLARSLSWYKEAGWLSY